MSSTLSLFRRPGLAWQRTKTSWKRRFETRISRWIRKRQGKDVLPLRISSRRLYILPTSVGLTFGIVCFAMLLGSMNYNNSMGFALTFLLAATGLVAMHRCHRNLADIEVIGAHAESVFAGESAVFVLQLRNAGGQPRYDLRARIDGRRSQPTDLAATSDAVLRVTIPAPARGIVRVGRFGLNTRFPLSLLRCWSWLYLDTQCYVWPSPAKDAPARPLSPSNNSGRLGTGGDEDFAGLRDYQDGDSPRLIAWKTFARSGELKSKRFEGSSVATTWIDIDSVAHGELEQRLSIMTRWLLEAEAAGEQYGLRLPGSEILPSRGRAHRDRCLDAMAGYKAPVFDHAS